VLFPTFEFACFFVFVFYVNWLLVHLNQDRKVFLLVASYFFYGSWDVHFLVLLAGSGVANFALGLAIDKVRSIPRWGAFLERSVVCLGVIFNLGVLGVFKYYNFFVTSLSALLHQFGISGGLPILDLVLPLGISFFTFQGISYLVDIYNKKIQAEARLEDVLLFFGFFPHLLAGPIVRASEFMPQLKTVPRPQKIEATRALLLIAFGLFKKMVLANHLGVEIVDPVFSAPQNCSTLDVLFGAYAYAIYIYCDFSAYSDMAIGFAKLLGFEFPINFDQPYRSQSLQEFWRRWHISLSRWLRDYLFIPLGGSRAGEWKTYRNILVTMLLGGIWHGASWTFVAWGFYHGAGLALERWNRNRHGPPCSCRWSTVGSILFVFHFVCLGWIFFRCENFDKVLRYLTAFTHITWASHWMTPFSVLLVATGGILNFMPKIVFQGFEEKAGEMPKPVLGLVFGLFLVFLSAVSPEEISPFIYFRF